MEKKIFRSIFAVALGVLIVNAIAFIHVLHSYYMDKNILEDLGITEYSLILSVLQPILIIAAGLLIVATVVASNVAKMIVEPINEIDLDNMEDNNIYESDVYEEITPLLSKISKQARQLQRQIREAEQKQAEFKTITENMNEGILVIDKKYEVLSYNQAIINLFTDGKVPSGKSVFSFNKSSKFKKIIKKTLNGKEKEKMLEVKDRNLLVMSNPVYKDTKIVGAVIIVMDVTETVQRDNYRREFTANVSHELKTPLTSISGFAEIMKSGIVPPEDMPEMANSIYEEAQRLIALVNDIIKLSALEDENISYENVDINLYELITEIKDRLSNVIDKKEIKFSIKCDNNIILNAPKQIVSELIYNLCDNGIKYNKQGGEVSVSIIEEKENIYINVKDTGIGIESEHHDRIFERFYRVDKSHSKEVGGTGLGLSIVKHDVSFLGGSISVDSKLGEGTSIQVHIPK